MSLSLAKRATPAPAAPQTAPVAAPPLLDSGKALEPATRSGFETGFGQDFSRVRVHDDARAHEAARGMSARAYAAGDHIVFGEGQYRPETPSGQALIAHELAHSVQQAGVAMKADGPLPAASDARLEAEADQAAADVLSGRGAPSLSRANRPAVFRNPTTTSAPAPGPASNMPAGFSADTATSATPGASDVTVWLDSFTLPEPKGSGKWVQDAYSETASGQRLGVILLAKGGGAGAWNSPAAWKEDSRTAEYLSAWLTRCGFTSAADLSNAVTKAASGATPKVTLDKDVKKLVKDLRGGLSNAKCDVDHIVEKQLGGTSQPSNLQILTSTVNQQSGREAYRALKDKAEEFRTYSTAWKNVRRLSIRIKAGVVPLGVEDASVKLEKLLRDNKDLGKAAVAAKADHKPLYLTGGGPGETIHVKDKGETEIDDSGVRVVPGIRLATYKREAGKADTVYGELDNRAMAKSKTKEKSRGVAFQAVAPEAGPAPAAAPDAAVPAGATDAAPVGGAPAGAEQRQLKLDKSKFTKLGFYYPYLSPGTITSIDQDAKGGLTGTGTIDPSVKFLGQLNIRFGPEELVLVKPIDVTALNNSAFMKPLAQSFRFTGGAFELDLMKFVPSGKVDFSMGPASNPLMTGFVAAKVEGGAFVATGKLTPGKIPGITAAEGEVTYHSEKGWEGSISAQSSVFGGDCNVKIGFRDQKEKIDFYGAGAISTEIRKGALLKLEAHWNGKSLGYAGGVTVPKPMPMVESVYLAGSYANEKLSLSGTVKNFTWKNRFIGDLNVKYNRKDGEEGKLSGSIDAKTIGKDKMEGNLHLKLSEDGKASGKGEIAYPVTKEIKPKLGVEYTQDEKLRLYGEVNIGHIPLSGEWPKKGGQRRDILKGLNAKVPIPSPILGLNPYFMVRGSLGVGYGVGPVGLNGVKFNGELWPLEDDPKIKAKLTGSLSAPGFAEVYGTFGARLGAEVLAGALGLNGGIDLTPSLRLNFNAGIDVNADYGADGFAIEAEAKVQAALMVSLAVNLQAEIYAAYGALSYTWTYPVSEPKPKRIGPELKVTLGKLSYSKDKGLVFPSLDQIDYEPKEFEPMSLIKDLLAESKPKPV